MSWEGANLSAVVFDGASLEGARFTRCLLNGASFREANLKDVVFESCILTNCGFERAAATGAFFLRSSLSGSSFLEADLRRVLLRDCMVQHAVFSAADLRGAHLEEQSFYGAFLTGAKLRGAELPPYQNVPATGTFIGYKKVGRQAVLELLIGEDSRRTSSLVGRKCRADRVKVLRAMPGIGDWKGVQEWASTWNSSFTYKVGQWVQEPRYQADPRIECARGIHFFPTFAEALAY
jgi:hypothetical protein